MAIWVGIGMNYGHNISNVNYDTTQVEADFTLLRAAGVSRLRIAAPPYTGLSIPNCQDMVTRALAHGFYVLWGVTTTGTTTLTIWNALKSYVTGTLAPWAQSVGLSELSMGNEEETRADNSTITAATMRSDLRAQATTIKAGGYTGVVSCQVTAGQRTNWFSEGIGALDLLGVNCYDVLANFTTVVTSVQTNLGAKGYVSEFGCIAKGYADYGLESLWYTDVVNRISAMQSAGVSRGYFFCYRDGGFGLSPDTFAVVLSNGDVRQARYAVLGLAIPQTFSMTQL